MPVTQQTPFNSFTAAAGATVFSSSFRVILASDLVVRVNGAVRTTGFIVSGLGAAGGVDVTFTTPMTGGELVELLREVPLTRATDYQQLGDFLSPMVNLDFDRIWHALQSQGARQGGAVRAPFPEQINELPAAAARAGRLLAFDAQGNPTTALPVDDSATDVRNDLAGAQGSALIGYTPAGTGAVPTNVQAKLRRIRQASDNGARPGATPEQNTAAIQRLIDDMHAEGGGIVELDYPGTYQLSASTSSEVFDNNGSGVAATTGCLVLRSGVVLRGIGIATKLAPVSPTLTAINVVSPSSGGIRGLSIDGGWTSSGAGHGIFCVNGPGGVDPVFENFTFEDLYISNVGSYAIGVQNGNVNNVSLSRIRIYRAGADGIDIKNRGSAMDNKALFLSDIFVDAFGLRLDGQAGVDVRGIVNANNIQVFNVGRAGVVQSGIRFRTASAVAPNQGWAAGSSLTNFFVRTSSASLSGTDGLVIGSSDVAVSNGAVDGCQIGVGVGGNASAAVSNVGVSNVVVKNAGNRAFVETTGSTGVTYTACASVTGAVGFRNEGTNTVLIGCTDQGSTTAQSSSGGAEPTLLQVGCNFGGEYVRTTRITAGRVGIAAAGSGADIDLQISPKGTGVIRYGALVATADAPVVGHILIKDAAGTTRKLAVVA